MKNTGMHEYKTGLCFYLNIIWMSLASVCIETTCNTGLLYNNWQHWHTFKFLLSTSNN